ncbi:MAG: hypothetical protein JW785_05550 [Acidimicrobiia bacterium]|nr:hypothetical protein [Acidimicrobiia bacterium]
MPRSPLRRRLRYRFDNFMSRGGRSVFTSLLVIFLFVLVLLIVVRLLLAALLPGEQPRGFGWSSFTTFLQMTDPGSVGEDAASRGWFQAVAIAAGISGIVMLSALIAFITTAVDRRLHDLRKGHSQVVEEDHTLILGWDEQRVVEITRELIVANESRKHRAVVILADQDKEYMDDYLAIGVPRRATTTLVTRSGNPSSLTNLQLAAVGTAGTVIVLSGCADSSPAALREESDARVVKTLLAVQHQRPESNPLHVVTEIFDPVIRSLVGETAGSSVVALHARDMLSRILVQTSRSIGLSVVYDELLSFAGNEIYFFRADWGGATFGELQYRFVRSVPIGICPAEGGLLFNPAPQRRMEPTDELLVIADDDSTIALLPAPATPPGSRRLPARRLDQAAERHLIVGHTHKTPLVLRELGKYVAAGSSVDLMPRDHHAVNGGEVKAISGMVGGLNVATLDVDPLNPATWEQHRPADYNSIILLSEGDEVRNPDQIDAETILILLLIRRELERERARREVGTTVITELIESENQALAASTGVHDFVVSSRLVSMLLAQISEEPRIHEVCQSLFDEEGSEIYLKPAWLYLDDLPQQVTFSDLIGLAQQRSEVCLGVKLKADEDRQDRNYGITLAPPKTSEWRLNAADALVVLAEDET